MQRLKEAAEKAKIELSGMTTTNINLPLYHGGRYGTQASGHNADPRQVQRADRVIWWRKPWCRCVSALNDAGLKVSDISKVLLVGGSQPHPGSAGGSEEHYFGKEPLQGHQP